MHDQMYEVYILYQIYKQWCDDCTCSSLVSMEAIHSLCIEMYMYIYIYIYLKYKPNITFHVDALCSARTQ